MSAAKPSPFANIKNRLLAATAAFALALARVSPSYADLPAPKIQTPAANDNSVTAANTAFVTNAIAALKAFLLGATVNKAGDTMMGPFFLTNTLGLPAIPPLDQTYNTTYASMANVMKMGAGNQISYCPELSCLSTSPTHGSAPYNDHQRTSWLISAQTQMDNQAEEQTLGINTLIGTGARSTWTTSKAYALNANVLANGNIYRATVAGTSAASGSGPSGFGASGTSLQTDGSVTWKWINQSAIATKLGSYIETAMEGGAGFSEGLVTNFQMLSAQYAPNGIAADPTQGSVGIEHDFSNFSGTDCAPAVANCLGMSMAFSGSNQSLTGLQFDGGGYTGSKGGSVVWGLRFTNNFASAFDIDDMSNATVGLGFGVDGFGSSSHSRSAIQDGSTTPVSYLASGPNSDSVWKSTGNAAVGLNLAGAYTNGIALNGTYAGAQIVGTGWNVDPNGTLRSIAVVSSFFTKDSGGNQQTGATCTSGITGGLQIINGIVTHC